MTALGSLDLIRRDRGRRTALVGALAALALGVAASGAPATGAPPKPPPAPTKATACGVFTLAEAKTLIGPQAKVDASQSHTVNFGGQRNTQCAYSAGANALADLQMLIPLSAQQAQLLKTAFEGNQRTDQGTSVKALGAAAFWKSKVGTPAIYVLSASDVMFNLGATTNGTNSASQAKLEQVAGEIVKALG
jgi:hypothetical protein